MKFKMMLSMSPKEKSLHTIESSKDLEVAFDKYVIGMAHIITIYVEREDKYILKKRSEDGKAELEKQRWRRRI